MAKYFSLKLLRAQQNCHPDRSVAQWRDLLFLFQFSHRLFRAGLKFGGAALRASGADAFSCTVLARRD